MSTPEYTISVGRYGVTLLWQGQTFEIEVEDLVGGGWEFQPECDRPHCDDGACPMCENCEGDPDIHAARQSVERWHNESDHFGAFRFCDEQPCKAVAREEPS